MKTSRTLQSVVAGLAVWAGPAQAQFSAAWSFNDVNRAIPDGSTLGVSDSRAVSGGPGAIIQIKVSLEISGGFTGDLYAVLSHDGASTVLLNRPGRRDGDPLGYDDSGLSVTFSDAASADVHTYRLQLTGNHAIPIAGPLGGLWQPDARTAAPGVVLDTSPRSPSSLLSAFTGHTPDGTWTLFVADLGPVGEATLKSWTLDITMVPEPACVGVWFAFGLGGWILGQRRRSPRGPAEL